MNKKKGNGFFIKTAQDSRILNFLFGLSDKIYKTASQSLAGGYLSSYDKTDKKAKEGFFAGILSKLSIDKRVFSPVKKAVSIRMEQSAVIRLIGGIKEYLLQLKASMLGLFMLSFGVSTLFVRFLKIYLINNEQLSFIALMLPMVICVSAVPFFFSSASIASALCNSRIMSFLLFDFLGLKRVSLQKLTDLKSFGSGMLILGSLFGALTYLVPAYSVIAFIFIILAAAMVLASPETGIVLLLLGLPFVSARSLAIFVFFIFCAYVFKLLCGKRTLKFDIFGITVLLYAVLLALGGFISFTRSASIKPMLIYLCFISAFFLIVNLIKSAAWLKRCASAIVVSSFAVCVYGALQRYVDFNRLFTGRMFIAGGGQTRSAFATPAILGTYLVMVIPFALSALISASGKNKLGMLIVTSVDILCLVYTAARGAWFGFAVGLVIFFIIYSKKTLAYGLLGLCVLPALSFLIPTDRLTYLSSATLSVIPSSDRVNIWHSTLRMIKGNFFGGVGAGTEAFKAVYPRYSVQGAEGVPHSYNLYLQIAAELGVFGLLLFLCIMILWLRKNVTLFSNEYCPSDGKLISCSCVSGIAAALINGCVDYIWSNYRVFLMFWIVMALAVSAYGIYMREIEKKRCRSDFDMI